MHVYVLMLKPVNCKMVMLRCHLASHRLQNSYNVFMHGPVPQRSSLAFLLLNLKPARFLETWVMKYPVTQRHIPV
jgi:hypothetical protein